MPPALLVPSVVGLVFLVAPLVALLLRAPWADLPSRLADPRFLEALRLSIVTSIMATLLSVVLGVPLAWVLARARVPGRSVLRGLVTLPLVLPPVVGGVSLLLLLGRRGLLGRGLFACCGISLPFTAGAVVLAEAFVAMPFLILAVEGALRTADPRYEEAAATLGASRWTAFRRVTLPLVSPGVAAATALVFIAIATELTATLLLAPIGTRTLATQFWSESSAMAYGAAAPYALLLVLLSIPATVLLGRMASPTPEAVRT